MTKGAKASARFPGLLRDLEIPRQFAGFRILLFVVLLVWPSIAHDVITVRSFTHMSIVFDYHGEAYLLPHDGRRGSEQDACKDLLQYCYLRQLGWFYRPSEADGGEWRWLHFRDRNLVYRPADDLKNGGWAIESEHWPTAYPFFQPWGFLLIAVGLSTSTFFMIARTISGK
jgi:hypothetical protein